MFQRSAGRCEHPAVAFLAAFGLESLRDLAEGEQLADAGLIGAHDGPAAP